MTAPAPRRGTALLGAALLALGAAALGACSEAFDPRLPDDRAFAVYGRLDGRQDTQRVRVQDLAAPVGVTVGALPAEVVSVERTTGATAVWTDSLVRLADGSRDHLFSAPLALRPGQRYELRLTRTTDGATSRVEIDLPAPTLALAPLGEGLSGRLSVLELPTPLTEVAVRYRARLADETAASELLTPYGVQAADGSFLLAFGDDVERMIALVFGGRRPVVLLGATLEGLARSPGPVPVGNGVGGVEWTVPVAVPVPLRTEDVEAAGLVDGR